MELVLNAASFQELLFFYIRPVFNNFNRFPDQAEKLEHSRYRFWGIKQKSYGPDQNALYFISFLL